MSTRIRTPSVTTEWLALALAGVPGTILAVLAAAEIVSERTALILFAPSFIGLNLAHMAASWGHAYLDDERWRSAWIERLAIPALLVIGSLGLEAVGWGAVLLGAQYWLSIHHAGMQNYGILRYSQRRSGRVLAERALRLDQAACVLLPLGALAYRARAVCREYDGAMLPLPPVWLVVLLMAAGSVALAAYLVRELLSAIRGQPVDPLGVVLVLLTNLCWTALIMTLSHPALPLYALASGHYIQQLYFVWRFEARRAGFSALAPPLRSVIAPPARLGYLAGLGAAGAIVVSALTLASVGARELASALSLRPDAVLDVPPWLAAMIGVNLSHYWLEHRIWRTPTADQRPARAEVVSATS